MPLYRKALRDALSMMEGNDLEPTSALKQAASDNGIPYGPQMGQFVDWATQQLANQRSV